MKYFLITTLIYSSLSAQSVILKGNISKAPVNTTSPAVKKALQSQPPFPSNPEPLEWYSSTTLVDQQVAPNVYFAFDINTEKRMMQNKHNMSTTMYVIGKKGVLVADTQPTKRVNEELLELIREKTSLPILYIVNTTPQGDHHYGNMFFPKETKIIQHEETAKMIMSPEIFAENKAFISTLADPKDLEEIIPREADILITKQNSTLKIDLGEKIIEVKHFGGLQNEGDLFVYLPQDNVIFTGNNGYTSYPAFGGPWLFRGNINQYISSFENLLKFIPKDAMILPGHGVPTSVKIMDINLKYLKDFKLKVEKAYKSKVSVDNAVLDITKEMEKEYGGFATYKMFQDLNIRSFYEAQNKKK